MEQSTYLCRFDEAGRRKETYVTTGMSAEEKSAYLASGYVEIPESEWLYYIGGMGRGDNDTGYIRDPQTGKTVSAPPAPHVEPEPATPPVDEERLAAFEAMAAQEARLVAQGERIAALEAELSALKGGEGK